MKKSISNLNKAWLLLLLLGLPVAGFAYSSSVAPSSVLDSVVDFITSKFFVSVATLAIAVIGYGVLSGHPAALEKGKRWVIGICLVLGAGFITNIVVSGH